VVSGVLARKSKKERLEPLFFMLDTFHARQSAGANILNSIFVGLANIRRETHATSANSRLRHGLV
jgi:hypothetical protein